MDYLAEVWLNGMHVGGHEGGETPFVLEVTDMDTGVTKTYAKDAGGYCGNSDTAAF